MFCGNCGMEYDNRMTNCPHCGAYQTTNQSVNYGNQPQQVNRPYQNNQQPYYQQPMNYGYQRPPQNFGSQYQADVIAYENLNIKEQSAKAKNLAITGLIVTFFFSLVGLIICGQGKKKSRQAKGMRPDNAELFELYKFCSTMYGLSWLIAFVKFVVFLVAMIVSS